MLLFLSQTLFATSVQEIGVRPENSPAVNKFNLKKAINWASVRGASLFFDPSDIPYHIDAGIIIQRFIGGQYSPDIVDAVIAKKSYSYSIDHTDNAQLIDLFTFGTFGGIYLGNESYGQLTVSVFGSRMKDYVSDSPLSLSLIHI